MDPRLKIFEFNFKLFFWINRRNKFNVNQLCKKKD